MLQYQKKCFFTKKFNKNIQTAPQWGNKPQIGKHLTKSLKKIYKNIYNINFFELNPNFLDALLFHIKKVLGEQKKLWICIVDSFCPGFSLALIAHDKWPAERVRRSLEPTPSNLLCSENRSLHYY